VGLLQSERVVGSNGLAGGPVQHLSLSSSTGRVLHRTKYNLIHFCYSYETESWVQKSKKTLKNNKFMKNVPKMLLYVFTILFRKVYKIGYLEK
jgi:hypothetical protein